MTPDPDARIQAIADTAILGLDQAVLSILKAATALAVAYVLLAHPDQVVGWVSQIIGGGS